MRATREVLLVRHGESVGNAGAATDDAASAPLTARGESAARLVAQHLPWEPDLIVASGYERARATSQPTRQRFPAVRCEEWPVHEFTYLAPTLYRGTTVADREADVAAYWLAGRPHRVHGDGAESFTQFEGRLRAARTRLAESSAQRIVVFSHKKFLNGLLWTWLTGDAPTSRRRMAQFRHFDQAVEFRNGAWVRVHFAPGGAAIGPVETAHLAALPDREGDDGHGDDGGGGGGDRAGAGAGGGAP
jgi:broad specificity phosphatase PhoE